MSRDASVTLDWADGQFTFRLAFGQLRELQEKCDAGPNFILNRLVSGSWRVDDIYETIRLGLIGGGMKPLDALIKVRRYVEERPLAESIMPAMAILQAAIIGAPDEDELKKEEAAKEAANSSSEESSLLPQSMEPAVH